MFELTNKLDVIVWVIIDRWRNISHTPVDKLTNKPLIYLTLVTSMSLFELSYSWRIIISWLYKKSSPAPNSSIKILLQGLFTRRYQYVYICVCESYRFGYFICKAKSRILILLLRFFIYRILVKKNKPAGGTYSQTVAMMHGLLYICSVVEVRWSLVTPRYIYCGLRCWWQEQGSLSLCFFFPTWSRRHGYHSRMHIQYTTELWNYTTYLSTESIL